MPMFIKLSPKHTKSVTELEIWEKGIHRIERYTVGMLSPTYYDELAYLS